ncbi:MAG: hypothetical protein DRH90_25765 [Deltaproteobacteria bacterium]|nr:MAG: hypothetical protein DRH90_25765 [Deltaproteobacteria bacterium]
MTIVLEDRISVPTERQFTDAGQMIVPCKFARTGTQVYTAAQLQLDGDPTRLVTVHREAKDVFAKDSMASFRSAPVTQGHPKSGLVTADTAAKLQVGMLEGLPVRDDDTLSGTLVITHQDAIDSIEDGQRELSAGYTCNIDTVVTDGEPTYYQRDIRANHIAIVPRGRAGSVCSIADEEVTMTPEEKAAQEAAKVALTDEAAAKAAAEKVLADEAAEKEAAEKLLADEKAAEELLAAEPTTVSVEDHSALKADLEALQAKFDAAEEAASAKLALADAALVDAVEERVTVVLSALDLTEIALADFAGKSVQEIKAMVVADVKPELSLEDRSDSYVAARFDILAEEAGDGETPMGRLLADNASASHVEVKPSTVVADARAAMIARTTKASK